MLRVLLQVEVEVMYPQCCGMPQLEQGRVSEVAAAAKKIAPQLLQYLTIYLCLCVCVCGSYQYNA
jgi:Fe-S oxidoreductase